MAARLRKTLATPRARLILTSAILAAGGWITAGVAHAQQPTPAVVRGQWPVVSSSRFSDAAPAMSPAGMRSVVIEHEAEYSPYAEHGQPIIDEAAGDGGLVGPGEFVPGDNYGVCPGPDCRQGQSCKHGCKQCPPLVNAQCEPIGIWQRLHALDARHGIDHVLRADALILWRNAPPSHPLFTTTSDLPILNADQLNSPAAGGGRLSYFRQNQCGEAWEATYLYGGQFFDNRNLPFTTDQSLGYLTAPPGIFGIDRSDPVNFLNEVDTALTGSLQSAELNRRWALGPSAQFLAGFRWLQWFEAVSITDTYGAGTIDAGQDIYENSAINNLWGGQIGIDALLLRTRGGFRVEGIVKAGAYANNAGQNAIYRNLVGGAEFYANSVGVRQSPAAASFVGEVGMTGVIPLDPNWDFRFGYLGLWLTGLAQPTNQLAGQNLAPPGNATAGSLNAAGSVIVQGLTLGLEGRW